MAYSLFEKPKGLTFRVNPFLLVWIFVSLTGDYGLLLQRRLGYHFGMRNIE